MPPKDVEGEKRLARFIADGDHKPYNFTLHSDFMPKRVLVQKSTVQLLVGGVWWSEPAPEPEIKEAA